MKCKECGGSGVIKLLTSSRPCLACKPDADGLTDAELLEWLRLHPQMRVDSLGELYEHRESNEPQSDWWSKVDAAISERYQAMGWDMPATNWT